MNSNSFLPAPYLIIIFGVSACGKSTVAKHLAKSLSVAFVEADAFHSKENIEHMAAGKPLSDDMREPWMSSICSHLNHRLSEGKNCVIAHSCLRKQHRQQFRTLGAHTLFFHLAGNYSLIEKRLRNRVDHFMPPSLLASQFSTLESYSEESDVIQIDIQQPIEQIINIILEHVSNKTLKKEYE